MRRAGRLDERFEVLVGRIARMPVNQLVMMKLLCNQTLLGGTLQSSQTLGTLLDGITRHTPEGYGFSRRPAEAGFRQAVRERDERFGDHGRRRSRDDPRVRGGWHPAGVDDSLRQGRRIGSPAPVAQWMRASDYGSEGRGFESLPARRGVAGPLSPTAGSVGAPVGGG